MNRTLYFFAVLLAALSCGAAYTNLILGADGTVRKYTGNGMDVFAGKEIEHTDEAPLRITATTVFLNTSVYWIDGVPYLGATPFTILFATGTPPANLVLGVGNTYAGPASTSATAEYDSGDGVWRTYTSNTIAMNGNYISFRGDWRDAAGTYQNIFYNSLTGGGYTCEFRVRSIMRLQLLTHIILRSEAIRV